MKRILLLAVFAIGAWYASQQADRQAAPAVGDASPASVAQSNDAGWRSGQQVQGRGTVTRILSDDNDGSRHQRFILRIASGRTLLIAHNIDLAPRIASLQTGDSVAFYGEYERNDKGGVIHWTHRDPQDRHVGGWLEHNGRRYE
jgi:hypothetical protein